MTWKIRRGHCPICQGNLGWWRTVRMPGKKRDSTIWITCETCEGTGWYNFYVYQWDIGDTEKDKIPPWERDQ